MKKFVIFLTVLVNFSVSHAQNLIEKPDLVDTMVIKNELLGTSRVHFKEGTQIIEHISWFQGDVLVQKRFCRNSASGVRNRSLEFPVFYEDKLCERYVKEAGGESDTIFEKSRILVTNELGYLWYENGFKKRSFELIGKDTSLMWQLNFNIVGDTVRYTHYSLILKDDNSCWTRHGIEYLFDEIDNIKRYKEYKSGVLISERIYFKDAYVDEVFYK